jgi:hypothetical protein
MTRKKPLSQLKRPRRRLGDALRFCLSCPLCCSGRIGVIRWGERTTRFECQSCELRFSLDLKQTADTLTQRAERFENTTGWRYGEKTLMLGGVEGARELGKFIDDARQVYPGARYAWKETD